MSTGKDTESATSTNSQKSREGKDLRKTTTRKQTVKNKVKDEPSTLHTHHRVLAKASGSAPPGETSSGEQSLGVWKGHQQRIQQFSSGYEPGTSFHQSSEHDLSGRVSPNHSQERLLTPQDIHRRQKEYSNMVEMSQLKKRSHVHTTWKGKSNEGLEVIRMKDRIAMEVARYKNEMSTQLTLTDSATVSQTASITETSMKSSTSYSEPTKLRIPYGDRRSKRTQSYTHFHLMRRSSIGTKYLGWASANIGHTSIASAFNTSETKKERNVSTEKEEHSMLQSHTAQLKRMYSKSRSISTVRQMGRIRRLSMDADHVLDSRTESMKPRKISKLKTGYMKTDANLKPTSYLTRLSVHLKEPMSMSGFSMPENKYLSATKVSVPKIRKSGLSTSTLQPPLTSSVSRTGSHLVFSRHIEVSEEQPWHKRLSQLGTEPVPSECILKIKRSPSSKRSDTKPSQGQLESKREADNSESEHVEERSDVDYAITESSSRQTSSTSVTSRKERKPVSDWANLPVVQSVPGTVIPTSQEKSEAMSSQSECEKLPSISKSQSLLEASLHKDWMKHSPTDIRSRPGRLLAAVQALYSTQMDRAQDVDAKGVPKVYRDLFQLQNVPLTPQNLEIIMHDLGVAALEEMCQREPRSYYHLDGDYQLQIPGRLTKTTVYSPELLQRLVNRAFVHHLFMFPRHRKTEKPWEGCTEGVEFPDLRISDESTLAVEEDETVIAGMEKIIGIPMDRELREYRRDYFRRLDEAIAKRKSIKVRKKWRVTYRAVMLVLKLNRNLAERSIMKEVEPTTYVDIGDSLYVQTKDVQDPCCPAIDLKKFKRKKEISISASVKTTLTSLPEDRTLVQLEEARRELETVQVFAEYSLHVQEQILRRAFYLQIGRKRVIIRQNHPPVNFYIIISGDGYVKLREWDEEKGEIVAKVGGFLKAGDTFGGLALIRGVNRHASVICRTSMQLLAIHGDDYINLICKLTSYELPPHLQFISEMNFLTDFPVHLLKEKLNLCGMHTFRRNVVITHDSRTCRNLFIIKYGYCKVFRKVDSSDICHTDPETTISYKLRGKDMNTTFTLADYVMKDKRYLETDSPFVSYIETRSPAGMAVKMPVTKILGHSDKIHNPPLQLPKEQRQFVPLLVLRKGEVYGLDQTPLCKDRHKSRSTILVSLGAEVIALSKNFFCRHAPEEAKELAAKTIIYDDVMIKRRLNERCNRDVHLEEVLIHYFKKLDRARLETRARTSEVLLDV